MTPTPIDLTDSRNFVSGVPYEWFAYLRANAPGLLARGGRRARLLGHDPSRGLRHGQSRRPALLLLPQGDLLVGDARGPARAAAAHDGDDGPPAAHPVPAPGQQGLHAPHDRGAAAEHPRRRRRDHRPDLRVGLGRLRHRRRRRAPARRPGRAPRRPARGPVEDVRLVQPDDRTRGRRVPGRPGRRRGERGIGRGGAVRVRGGALRAEARQPRRRPHERVDPGRAGRASGCRSSSSTCSSCCWRWRGTRPPAT